MINFKKLNRSLLVIALAAFAISANAQDVGNSNQLDEILKELRELRSTVNSLITALGPSAGGGVLNRTTSTQFDVGNSPLLGSKDAALTIVEFTDFQCPFCNRFFVQTFPELKKNYIDTGKVRYYSLDFPLGMHDKALQAAQAGRCAAEQQKFWPMHGRMHANPNALDVKNLVEYATESDLDVPVFRKCLEEEKYKQAVQSAVQEASLKAVSGTPTFVIGKSTTTGVEGTLLIGAQPYETFDRMIKELLRSKSD